MLGVGCLVKNTALLQDLKDLVAYIGYEQIANGKSASVASVYNVIRQSGIEVDLQSVGHIYNESLPKEYKEFQSNEEVDDYVLKNYKDAIERAAMLEDNESKETVGQDKPEIYVVNGLLNMFTNANVANESTQSDMLQMQNALWKGIQRKLNLPESAKPKTSDEWKDILNQSLGYEQLGITDLNGRLNSIADLYNAMRTQLQDAGKELIRKGDWEEVEKWFEMVDALEASTYSLLFSRGEAKNLLEGMMKEAGFSKKLKDGTTILDWNKLAGGIGNAQDVRDNVERVLRDQGFGADVISGVSKSLENEFINFQAKILEKADKTLANQESRIGQSPDKKSDLKRLAELNNLGVFESSHDKVLYNLIGIPDLQQQDIDDLKSLSRAASELFREIDNKFGSDIYASRHLQTIQRSIDQIVARNINNKTRLMKIVNAIKAFFDLYLTGLLMRPFTILENLWSGVKEIIVPQIFGKGMKKEDLEIYRKMLSDVTIRGQSFGEEIGNFSPQELYTNTLKFNWDKSNVKKAENILAALMLPGRIGLLGFDSANKVTITNRVFNNSIYQALTQQGMSKDDATRFMNESLYGKSWEDAKTQAKEMIEKFNEKLPDKLKVPVNSRTITTFANDLVKHNLNANGALTNEVIEAAYKSAYHVAGYGLGHEANNWLSSGIKQYRNRRKAEEKRLVKEKDWNKVAMHRLKDTFTNSFIIRFTGGATNWIYLRFQSGLGLGLVTGFMGNWNGDIDFKDKKAVQQSIKDIQNRRNMIARSVVGISSTMLAYAIGYALYGSGGGSDEDKIKLAELKKRRDEVKEKTWPSGAKKSKAATLSEIATEIEAVEKNMSAYKRIKGDWMTSRLFRKVAPDIMLLHYYLDSGTNDYLAVLNYVQQTTGLGSGFSTSGKILSATELAYRKDYDAANGELASIAGDRFGAPTWNAYKDWGKLVQWIGGGKPSSDYKKPTEFSEGLWGGGALEDLGFFNRNPTITNLPGIGGKGYEKFKAKGIERMDDLKKNPDWFNMKGKDGKYILDKDDREKAKKGFEKYIEQE